MQPFHVAWVQSAIVNVVVVALGQDEKIAVLSGLNEGLPFLNGHDSVHDRNGLAPKIINDDITRHERLIPMRPA